MKIPTLCLVVSAMLLSGCVWGIDWGGPWFGCSKGQVKKPTTYKMFGTVNQSAKCVPTEESAYSAYSAEDKAKRKKDFQYCTDARIDPNEPVEECMEQLGWRP